MYPNDTTNEIPYGYCQCGCGQKTKISQKSHTESGYVRGEPRQYLPGHGTYLDPHVRFWKHVDPGQPDDCWEWQGNRYKNGYGKLSTRGKSLLAHRISYEIHFGPIPTNQYVCHTCDNPACVNPHHLWLGTPTDNVTDMRQKSRHVDRPSRGEANGNSKLTEADIVVIRNLKEQGIAQTDIATRYNVSPGLIGHIINGRSWRHVP